VRKGKKRVQAVGGPTLGSDPLAAACAVISHLEGDPLLAFIIRKEPKGHGTRAWVEGAKHLEAGAPVAIIEDVVTTGGSSIKAAEKAKEAGLDVVKIVCLVDRGEGGAEAIRAAGYEFDSILSIAEVRHARAA
jgi:orotate phosphoribosyltransferase